jgi:hypothetical protein
MAHDYGYRGRVQGRGSSEDALDDWEASNPMEHLGKRGFHSGALAGGKDHGVNIWSIDQF